jgi:hypothetical protein
MTGKVPGNISGEAIYLKKQGWLPLFFYGVTNSGGGLVNPGAK